MAVERSREPLGQTGVGFFFFGPNSATSHGMTSSKYINFSEFQVFLSLKLGCIYFAFLGPWHMPGTALGSAYLRKGPLCPWT